MLHLTQSSNLITSSHYSRLKQSILNMNLKTESEVIVMKTVNYFLSPRNLCVFASILFLSQNALAGRKYSEWGHSGGGDDYIKVRIMSRAYYTLDSVTVMSHCSGESIKRKSNLNGNPLGVDEQYSYWYLKPECEYTFSGTIHRAKGKKKNIPSITYFIKNRTQKYCSVTFRGDLFKADINVQSCK